MCPATPQPSSTVPPVPLSPALRLLLRAAPQNGVDSDGLAAALTAVTDWPGLVELANRHRLAPPLCRTFDRRQVYQERIPPDCFAALRSRANGAAIGALLQLTETQRVAAQFERGGVPFLVFKGPVLAEQAFGDPACRHVGDLDLVIAEADIEAADAAMTALGYRRSKPAFELSPRQSRAYRGRFADYGYRHPGHPLVVELHWRFLHNPWLFPVDVATLLARADRVRVSGLTLAAMQPGDLVLSLCAHGAKHLWFRLFWLLDVHALLGRRPIAEQRDYLDRAEALGIERLFLLAVLLTHRLFQTRIEPSVLAAARRDRATGRLAATALQAIGEGPDHWSSRGVRSWRESLQRRAYMWRLRRGFRYHWWMIAGTLVNPPDWRRVPLPDALFFLYRPLRPLLALWPFRCRGR